jgi:hypothetical protein
MQPLRLFFTVKNGKDERFLKKRFKLDYPKNGKILRKGNIN